MPTFVNDLLSLTTNPLLLAGLAAGMISGITSILAFPLVARLAMATRAVDYPGGRRSQKEAVPRTGGIAIAAGIGVGALLGTWLIWQGWTERATPGQLFALILATASVFAV